MKVISLFDGMSCGMIAMKLAGIPVERYDAWEIDKYAVTASTHNFPEIHQHGDVFNADFTEYRGYDFLVGGSPCTYWSIAQSPDKRETTASGIGWELFSQYVRALHEAQPRMFIYENNKSMSKDIRASITETFGFEPICINSALVSAQNRQRLYWVGVRNEDGTYRKASIEQPADRGILLKDVLDSAAAAETISDRSMAYMTRDHGDRRWNHMSKPGEDEKSHTITANISKGVTYNCCAEPVRVDPINGEPLAFSMTGDLTNRRAGTSEKAYCLAANPSSDMAARVIEPVALQEQPFGRKADENGRYDRRWEAKTDGKSPALTSVDARRLVAEPAACRQVGRRVGEDGHRHDNDKTVPHFQRLEVNDNSQQTNALTTVSKDNLIAEPVCGRYERSEEAKACRAAYEKHEVHHGFHELHELHPRTDGKTNTISTVQKDNPLIEPVRVGTMPSADGRQGGGQVMRIYDPDGKSTTLKANAGGGGGGKTGLYATQEKDAKGQRVYTVQDGQIEVNGKRYPIKLKDGRYIIRKLTVSECMRLQTVPEWYDFSCVSNTQAYKMLGNGWTVEVIAHLIRGAIKSSILGI